MYNSSIMSWRVEEKGFDRPKFLIEQAMAFLSRKTQRPTEKPTTSSRPDFQIVNIFDNHGFNVSECIFDPNGKNTTVLVVNLTNSKFAIRQATNGHRKTLEANAHVALPLGPIEGDYQGNNHWSSRLKFYTSDGTQIFGSTNVVDRFENLKKELNKTYSGGIIIHPDGSLEIVDQEAIKQSQQLRTPSGQLFYNFSNTNADKLLAEYWHHMGKQQTIDHSTQSWSWYYQDDKKLLFLCAKKGPGFLRNVLTVRDICVINSYISQGKNWRAGLSCFGLSGGFVIRNFGGHSFSSHNEPGMFHTTPAILVGYPK